MYRLGALIVIFISWLPCRAQTLQAEVGSSVAAVNLDSLILYVSELSGEAPIYVADSTLVVEQVYTDVIDSLWVSDAFVKLPNRVEWANDAATDYLVGRLKGFGYDSVVVDAYPTNRRFPTTKNVVAVKPGTDPGGPVWLIGAHYDSVLLAPGADDNASGTAVVLECARVLADADLAATVIFGLWDTEEAGLIGSSLFASKARAEGLRIDGVLNFDMVGWDGNGNHKVQIHADEPAFWIAEYLRDVVSLYGLDLQTYLIKPGIGRSDHVSFRNEGYPAVLIIEEFWDDFNPYYHSPQDRIEYFDTSFFHEVARLAVATVAQLALSGTTVEIEGEFPAAAGWTFESISPNPAADVVAFRFSRDGQPGRLVVTDVLGRLVSEWKLDAEASVRWVLPHRITNGPYFATLISGHGVQTRSFVVLR